MAKYGSDEVYISIDDGTIASPGTHRDVSADVLEISGIDKEAMVEEGHGFGDAWVENLPTGLNKVSDITIKGFYDDTESTGTVYLFDRIGVTTEVYIGFGGGKSLTAPVLIKNFRRLPSRGELHKFEAVLVAAGEPEEDAT